MNIDKAIKKLWNLSFASTRAKVDIDDLIKNIYDDFESRTCENCKHGGLSTMGYTDCLNRNVNHLWQDKKLPDDMSCKRWEKDNWFKENK